MTAPDAGDVRFREVRAFRRGSMAPIYLVLGVVLVGAALFVPPLGALGVLLLLFLVQEVETVVDGHELRLRLRPLPLWRKAIDLREVTAVELTVVDHQEEMFGGWNAREDVVSALATDVEGDRSVGNRAIVLTFADGRTHQLGSFRPAQLREAIEEGRGRGR